MAQRIRTCCNNTNMDTIQCDSYLTKLQRPRPATNRTMPAKLNRDRSVSRSRCQAASLASTFISSPRNVGDVPAVARNRSPPSKRQSSVLSMKPTVDPQQNVIHKEMYTDNLVEVTVKTHGNNNNRDRERPKSQSRPNSPHRQSERAPVHREPVHREPWGKMLKQQHFSSVTSTHTSNDRIENQGYTFNNYDPLRTLHFLVQELQAKMQDNIPSDNSSVVHILTDMQRALSRVPPEIAAASSVLIAQTLENKPQPAAYEISTNTGNYEPPTREREDMSKEKLIQIVRTSTDSKSCQTMKLKNIVMEPEKFQQHLEDSTQKIENACKQMEVVCSKLKLDKEELEYQLKSEKELVRKLKSQIMDQQEKLSSTSANSATSHTQLAQLRDQNALLKAQLSQLIAVQSSQHDQSADVRSLLQQLQRQKDQSDDQCLQLRQQLTIARMETERHMAVLSARDRQVAEIRQEMCTLQDLVGEQLRELQTGGIGTGGTTSMASSFSNVTNSENSSLYGKFLASKPITSGCPYLNSPPMSGNTSASGASSVELPVPPRTTVTTTTIADKKKQLKLANLPHKHIQLKQPATVLEQQASKTLDKLNSNFSNIRDVFAEIKKQALLVNTNMLPNPPSREQQQRLTSIEEIKTAVDKYGNSGSGAVGGGGGKKIKAQH